LKPDTLRAITLDLDDTLWPSAPAIAAAEAKLHEWLEREAPRVAAALPPPEFMKFRRAMALELPHIAHDFTALRHAALTRALDLHGERAALADAAMEIFLAARSAVELYPDVIEALERLSSRYPLVALSNGNADIELAGVGRYFTATVNARTAGCAKPDRRIFHAACERVTSQPQEVLHVGDHPDLDVRAALAAGLRAGWMNRSRAAWIGEPAGYHDLHDLLVLCDALRV
jgi:putative hydrolase of the HAD superfamily